MSPACTHLTAMFESPATSEPKSKRGNPTPLVSSAGLSTWRHNPNTGAEALSYWDILQKLQWRVRAVQPPRCAVAGAVRYACHRRGARRNGRTPCVHRLRLGGTVPRAPRTPYTAPAARAVLPPSHSLGGFVSSQGFGGVAAVALLAGLLLWLVRQWGGRPWARLAELLTCVAASLLAAALVWATASDEEPFGIFRPAAVARYLVAR